MRKIIEAMYHGVVHVLFTVLGWFPKKDLILFESFHGKQYSDNPRAVYEYVQKKYPNYRCVWAVKKGCEKNFINYSVPYVRRLGVKWLLLMPRARYWVVNTRLPLWMKKSKHTVYIQTWHGTPLKKLGLDIDSVKIPETDTVDYREEFQAESRRWDYLFSPNPYSTEIFRHAFDYQGEVLETVYPRNTILLAYKDKEQRIREIKERLGIDEQKKIILYAPTWRDDHYIVKGAYRFNNQFPFEEIVALDSDFVVLTRLHYLIAEQLNIENQRVIDCSYYEDIRDLYLIADLLITDYSSVMFDFAITDKPMIFYMYDFEKYDKNIRGFYFDPYRILPGPITTDAATLIAAVDSTLSEKHFTLDRKYTEFKEQFAPYSELTDLDEVMDKLFGSID